MLSRWRTALGGIENSNADIGRLSRKDIDQHLDLFDEIAERAAVLRNRARAVAGGIVEKIRSLPIETTSAFMEFNVGSSGASFIDTKESRDLVGALKRETAHVDDVL